ncbi:MAG TPA: hypothetical protein PKI07_11550 [Verrucomicrobiota bacterium]|nr:MAG: hypothetical protein BWX68_00524 [Verrucomicrobia bacterium ADurb.Bin063]HOC51719.1 hypothetical protein [Verrucomicrobiota bacterium]
MEPLPSACESTPARTPQTIVWFRVYAAVMTGLYALCVLAAPLVFLAGTRRMGEEGLLLKIQAGVLLLMGLVFALAFALALVLPSKPWSWVYGLAQTFHTCKAGARASCPLSPFGGCKRARCPRSGLRVFRAGREISRLVRSCLGMTSCCLLPVVIPLLIYWLKPGVKNWFNPGASL